MTTRHPDTALQGVVGSTAYGLARDGSDTDRLGVFVAPTMDVAGLDWHPSKETRHGATDGDHTEHEVGKYLRLALKANPTITELLWLPEHEVKTEAGALLVNARHHLLSTPTVTDSYLGYAHAQARKLLCLHDVYGARLADRPDRAFKHARHCLRLLEQARQLLTSGVLVVRVPDPEKYWALGELTVAQFTDQYERTAGHVRDVATRSCLPEHPDRDHARRVLALIRRLSDITTTGRHWYEEGARR